MESGSSSLKERTPSTLRETMRRDDLGGFRVRQGKLLQVMRGTRVVGHAVFKDTKSLVITISVDVLHKIMGLMPKDEKSIRIAFETCHANEARELCYLADSARGGDSLPIKLITADSLDRLLRETKSPFEWKLFQNV